MRLANITVINAGTGVQYIHSYQSFVSLQMTHCQLRNHEQSKCHKDATKVMAVLPASWVIHFLLHLLWNTQRAEKLYWKYFRYCY